MLRYSDHHNNNTKYFTGKIILFNERFLWIDDEIW
jgi:hypothetical protein